MRRLLSVALLSLAASCGYGATENLVCEDHHCGLPLPPSGGFRSCHEKANVKSGCFLQNEDGRVFTCTDSCDCTAAQAQIDSWCKALK